ncbi:DUF317 domain-containing protein [Streptomyces sp. NPDC056244]|uniref:DUF317 domain-containing protein n=1 Tax=Streptomyces sp. NPDC056244 TaxID=3345762 RepID=UPI0035E30605
MADPQPERALARHQRAGRETTYDDVLVSPRYLAGSTGCGDDGFAPLTDHYWHDMHDEMGNFYATTYDSRLRVAYLPEVSELMPDATALWQIRARTDHTTSPLWTAAFTDETPPEIVAAVTTQLNADVSASTAKAAAHLQRNDHPDTVWDVLRAADWRISVAGWHVEAHSPDTLVSLAYRPPVRTDGRGVPRDEAWRATIVATPGARRALWEADFHSATPAHVVAAFARGLVDPAPLSREQDTVPDACRSHARPVTAPEPERSASIRHRPTPLDVARARLVRPPAVTTSVPRWSTSTLPGAQLPTPVRPAARR